MASIALLILTRWTKCDPFAVVGGLGFMLYMLIDEALIGSANFAGYTQQVNFSFDDIEDRHLPNKN